MGECLSWLVKVTWLRSDEFDVGRMFSDIRSCVGIDAHYERGERDESRVNLLLVERNDFNLVPARARPRVVIASRQRRRGDPSSLRRHDRWIAASPRS
jgi:hypothetical protein